MFFFQRWILRKKFAVNHVKEEQEDIQEPAGILDLRNSMSGGCKIDVILKD